MPRDFIQQIDKKRRCLQRRRTIAATCWAVALAIAGTIALSGLDRALGMNDPAGRWLRSLALAWLGVAIGRRWWVAVARPRVTLLEVARRVERRYPQLRDVVTSAVDFSSQSPTDPCAGSESLRRVVVQRAALAIEEVDWQQLLPRRPLRRAALAVSGALLVLVVLAWWSPQALGTGATRLFNPLSTAAWPRVHDLKFVDPPTLLAAGDDFVVQLRDTHGALPRTVEMHYRTWRDGSWHYQTQPLAATGSVLDVHRGRVSESFEYRATGGDHHDMPWHRLQVVAPPRVQTLQVTVQPPAYTGRPTQPLAPNAPVLLGSGLEVEGQTDQPLARVTLRSEHGVRLPVALDSDRKTFRIAAKSWRAEQSDVFWFELITPAGLTTQSARRLAIEVVADQPPHVKFVEPTDDLTIAAEAQVSWILEARDDLAVQRIDLVYRRSDRSDQGDQVLPLFRGPDTAPSAMNGGAKLSAGDNAQRKRITYLWRLKSLALKPGSVVEVLARAGDYQPATGQTARRIRLFIVSQQELLRRLGQREVRILQRIGQILRQQRQVRLRVAKWAQAPEASAKHGANEGHAVLFRQRQIADALVKRPASVASDLKKVLNDLERNRLVRPETQRRLRSLQRLLSDLADGPLPAIEQLLGEWIRLSENDPKQPGNAGPMDRRKMVSAVTQRQDQVIDALQQALDRLTRWNALQQFESELLGLHHDQQQLWQTCRREIAPDWLQSRATHAAAEDALKRAARQERRLAGQLADLIAAMSQSVGQLSDHEPALAGRLAATIALAQQLAVQATMREAGDELQQRRLGRSMTLQQQAVSQLQALLAQLADAAKGDERDQSSGPSGDGQRQPPPSSETEAHQPMGTEQAGRQPGRASKPTTARDRDFAAALADTGKLVNDLWGHLPDRQRERILQPLHEDFLPQYATEIEDYFRALAESREEKER